MSEQFEKNPPPIEMLKLEDLPQGARSFFSTLVLPDITVVEGVGEPLVIKYDDARLYGLPYQRQGIKITGEGYDAMVYVVEFNNSNKRTGHGGIRRPQGSGQAPFVAYIETTEGFREKGYGRRRLLAMNSISKLIFGEPLDSGPAVNNRSEWVRAMWRRAVLQGLAAEYTEEGQPRWRFID